MQERRERCSSRHTSQCPNGPRFLILGQLAVTQSFNESLLNRIATSHQFVLCVDTSHRQRRIEFVDQFVDRASIQASVVGFARIPVFCGTSGEVHYWFILPGDSKDAAFVSELPVLPFSSVPAAPAEHPQRAVGSELHVGRAKERRTTFDERSEAAASRSQHGSIPLRSPQVGCLQQPIVDEENAPILRRELSRLAEDDSRT